MADPAHVAGYQRAADSPVRHCSNVIGTYLKWGRPGAYSGRLVYTILNLPLGSSPETTAPPSDSAEPIYAGLGPSGPVPAATGSRYHHKDFKNVDTIRRVGDTKIGDNVEVHP
jgi:hypothetical protein